MKRFICIISILLFTLLSFAQTQQGRVKTRGRMVNGKHIVGKGLSGAVVGIKGRNKVIVQKANGSFSFVVPSSTFMIDSVKKKGYELVDADATTKAYHHSTDTLYLIMETPEQKMEDLLEAEEQLSKTLREQLNKARLEIQRLRDEKKISEDEYNKRINKLMQDQQNNQKLIADMAKEYAQMDYDQMDELNQRISDAILNGRLTEADSLLRSKGDMKSRIAELKKEQKIIQQREEEIVREQAELAASKAGTQNKLEDIASDCFKFHERFQLENLHDSAAYYIELRAELDTTNTQWQFDAAYYLQNHLYLLNRINKHYSYYYQRIITQFGSNAINQLYGFNLYLYSTTLHNLGTYYENQGDTLKALEVLRLGLEGRKKYAIQSGNPDDENHVAWALVTLAELNYDTGEKEEAHTNLKEAADFYKRLLSLKLYKNEWAQIRVYILYCKFCHAEKKYELENEYYEKARYLIQKYTKDNPKYWIDNLRTVSYYRLATLSQGKHYEEMINIYKEIIELCRKYQSKDKIIINYIADYKSALANIYDQMQQYKLCENELKGALEIGRSLAKDNPQNYNSVLAGTLGSIAYCEIFIKKYYAAEQYASEGISVDSTQTWIYTNLAAALLFQGKYSEAEQIYREYKSELKRDFLNDFNQFERTGVIPKEYEEDVEKIKHILNE